MTKRLVDSSVEVGGIRVKGSWFAAVVAAGDPMGPGPNNIRAASEEDQGERAWEDG
jgi:hypothetical protein